MASILTIYISGWSHNGCQVDCYNTEKGYRASKIKYKNVIGPASISLGAMIGTGAIIGVQEALSKLSAKWTSKYRSYGYMGFNRFINNASISYSETLNSKIMGKSLPKRIYRRFNKSKFGILYAVYFTVALAVFGFGGFNLVEQTQLQQLY